MQSSREKSVEVHAVRVLSVKADIPVCVRFLGEYLGLDTHRKGGRPIACEGPGECPPATHRLGIIWKGYSPAEVWDGTSRLWCPVVLEITEALEELLRGRELRGEVWALSRESGKGPCSSVVGVFCQRIAAAQVPAAFDVVPVLLRLYHVASLRLGVKNLLPPKLLLGPSAGAPPVLPTELQPAPGRDLSAAEQEAARKAWEQFKRSGYRDLAPPAPETPPEAKNGHASGNGRK